MSDVPVDGFSSIPVYIADGFFEPNSRGVYRVNDITAVREADGSVVVHLGNWDESTPNCIPVLRAPRHFVTPDRAGVRGPPGRESCA